MVVAAGVTAAAGAATSAYGARKAGKQQAAAGREALATQQASQQRMDELMSPYSQAGGVAQDELMGMLGIGGKTSSYQNPMLKQIQEQTMQSMTNRAAATGRGTGGDMANVIAQSMIQPAYQMQQSRIGQLQGLTSMGAGAAANQAGMNSQIAGQMAGSQVNIGNAQAAGTAGMFGAIGDGLGQMSGMAGYMHDQQQQQQKSPGFRPTVPVSSAALIGQPLALNPMESNNFRTYNYPGTSRRGY